ncbi:hypothetical protein MCP1_10142 [Candidatus Terasakiella magnetica]|nr:hypothetical protein MCP1_10142 [Candidatus Terasakiella magnetica]
MNSQDIEQGIEAMNLVSNTAYADVYVAAVMAAKAKISAALAAVDLDGLAVMAAEARTATFILRRPPANLTTNEIIEWINAESVRRAVSRVERFAVKRAYRAALKRASLLPPNLPDL